MGSRNDDLPTNISLTGSDGPPGEPSVPEGDGTPSNGHIPEEGRALEADGVTGSDGPPGEPSIPEGDGTPSNGDIPEGDRAPEADGVTGSDGSPVEDDQPADDDSPGKDDDLVHTDSVADVGDNNDGPAEYRALEQERPRDLLQELIKAIEDGEPQTAKNLVAEHNELANMTFTYGASKESDNSEERTTPLLLAIELSRSGLVEILVDRGADVNLTVMNAKYYEGEPQTLKALKAAILCGSQVNLEEILEHSLDIINADISFTSEDVTGLTMDEITPSMLAVAFERPEITKLLEANGADTKATTVNDESTPFLPVTIETQLRTVQHFRNRRATGSPLVNGDHTMTPLLAAAQTGNEKVFDILLKHKADPTASEIMEIPRCIWLRRVETQPTLPAFRKEGTSQSLKDCNDETALIVAAMNNQKSIVERLIKFKANIESRDIWQYTALLNAATFQANSVLPSLLDAGANLAAKTGAGLNALQLACENNDGDTVRLLLGVPPIKLATLMRIGDHAGKTVLGWAIFQKSDPSIIFQLLESSFFFPLDPAQDEVHRSPKSEQVPIAKWLLNDSRRQEMLGHQVPVLYWALLNVQKVLCEVVMRQNPGSPPILEDRCGATWLHVIALSGNVDGLEWMKDNWSAHLLNKASRDFTPLHAAVENGHEKMVRILLEKIDEKDASRVLDVILGEGKDAESAIAVAVVNNEPEIEEQLWNKLRELFEAKKPSASPGVRQDGDDAHRKDEWRNTAERVVGAAAWRYTTGEEKYLNGFIDIYSAGKARAKDMGPLDFVVKYQFPTALWWLLSSGEYFGEILFRKGNELRNYGDGGDPADDRENWPTATVIRNLLTNPPSLRRPSNGKLLPEFEYERPVPRPVPQTDKTYAIVLDVTIKAKAQTAIKLKRGEIREILYGRGPNSIMMDTGYRDLQAMQDELFKRKTALSKKPAAEQPSAPPRESKNTTGKQGESSDASSMKQKQMRWFHIPTNNLQYVKVLVPPHLAEPWANWQQDLMVRISREKEHSQSTHRRLAKLVKRSWVEIPAGGEKHYMKPRCLFPYISWGAGPPKAQNHGKNEHNGQDHTEPGFDSHTEQQDPKSQSTSERLSKAISQPSPQPDEKVSWPESKQDTRKIVHEALTLDQYYYDSIKDTYTRDHDQALSRLFKTYKEKRAIQSTQPYEEQRPHHNHEPVGETLTTDCRDFFEPLSRRWKERRDKQIPHKQERNDQDRSYALQKDEAESFQILKVNQLWLWILHDGKINTIITSVTQEVEDGEKTFLERVLDKLNQADFDVPEEKKEQGSSLPAYQIRIVQGILDTARDMFDARDVLIDPPLKEKIAPLDVYRRAIQKMRDKEIELFAGFRDALNLKARKGESQARQTSQQNGLSSQRGPEPQKFWESKSTSENPYKRIDDETNVLHEIKDILDELNILKSLAHDQDNVAKSKFTLSEVSNDIQGMVRDAISIQTDINTLLDLKQKKAGIVEAQATRSQSDTVMSFTVVTIICLPASFLTSLFALDISDFPHENGNLVYQGRWIFPIIFGVSLVVSAFFVALAYNANWLKILIQRGMEHSRHWGWYETMRKRSQSLFHRGETKGGNHQENNEKPHTEPATPVEEQSRSEAPRSPGARWRTVQSILPFMKQPKPGTDVEGQHNAERAQTPSSHEQNPLKV
ncbi:uncharacterized protein BO66DRAFT_425383 [Aspergillus aculeatinus CBS 121060]|uniref:Uncharacterized protein n=1 Tax=Aspergillus aculeatinus CBS 121060 TaxID=1448322 RepID=A0ACD1HNQ8_9EURO|nr:hypothetical protein BO66DRAFT_425383 [Aspergillus aculeatinus CBS 121060]RAH75055.1 hypothetical protein BO66DRAFT_425383 [Aspergillus aculeatinus CBS 121060]